MISKVTNQHLQRAAYVYIRQSTLGQVRHHQESTQRQYALREKALELGWQEERIRVLDRDLGMSGAQASGREDFKTLAADVSMSRVGAVIALEASRLARSSADWYRLIEICALTETVIIDEDGCYDPADFNDSLLLGLKGTMSQAELHFIRARLQGGRLNKAKRGALRLPLPIGLCYQDDGGTVLDPDEQVQGAVGLLLSTFEKTGTAFAVVRHFARHGLTFPKRIFGGVAAGKLLWGHLGHARALAVLRNPTYAGAYVFGRYRVTKGLLADGQVTTGRKLTPRSSWPITIHDHHEGYITWEQYLGNQEVLAKNRTHGERTVVNGPAREGRALLQGLLLCSRCGKRVTVCYSGDGGRYAYYECDSLRRDGRAEISCLLLACRAVDEVISKRVLAVLEPVHLDRAIEAVRQLEQRDEGVMTQWRLRIERAEYEVGLAERRYEEVDPSNRLVATTLERRWEEALRTIEDLRKQQEVFASAHKVVVTPEQRSRVLALARDLPRLWNAPSTSARDRKRMLRLLLKDITVENDAGRREAVLHVRWQGGACEDLPVTLPPDRLRTSEDLAERICALAKTVRDAEIVATLNREGCRSARGSPLNVAIVRTIRRSRGIPGASWRAAGESSAPEIAVRYGVPRFVVDGWVARGSVEVRTIEGSRRFWIHVTAEQESILRREAERSSSVSASPSSDQGCAE